MLLQFGKRRVALAIGNASYTSAVGTLANSENDAREICRALRSCGFDAVLCVNQTSEEQAAAVADFLEKCDGAEAAIFFFSGHGLQVNGDNHLLPVDFDPQVRASLSGTIRVAELLKDVARKSGVCIFFLDACRDDPRAVKGVVKGGAKRELVRRVEIGFAGAGEAHVRPGLAELTFAPETSNAYIAFATAPGTVAYDGTGDNSPFTTALLRHIGIPKLDIEGMMQRVIRDVRTGTNSMQIPWKNSNLDRAFYFRQWLLAPVLLAPLFGIAAGLLPMFLLSNYSFDLASGESEVLIRDSVVAIIVSLLFGAFAALFCWVFDRRQAFMSVLLLGAMAFGTSLWADSFVTYWANSSTAEAELAERQAFISGKAGEGVNYGRSENMPAEDPSGLLREEADAAEPPHQVLKSIGEKVSLTYAKESRRLERQGEWYQSAKVSHRLLNGGGFLVFLSLAMSYLLSHVIPALRRTGILVYSALAALTISFMAPIALGASESEAAASYFRTANGWLVSMTLPMLVLGFAFATYISPSVIPRHRLFHSVPSWRPFAPPVAGAAICGMIGALSYPAGNLLSTAIPPFFGVQMLPAIPFSFLLAFVVYRHIERNSYLAVLVVISVLLAWFIMLPIAERAFGAVLGATVGATGFAIIVLASVTMTNPKLQWPALWAVGVVSAAAMAFPYGYIRDSNWTGGLLGSEKLELVLESASLFIPWEIGWIAVITYFCLRPGEDAGERKFGPRL